MSVKTATVECMTTVVADLSSKPARVWRSELGSLKARGVGDDDKRVRECRAALAFWRIKSAFDSVKSDLSGEAVDLLVSQLLGVSR